MKTKLKNDDVRLHLFNLYYSGIYDYYIGKTAS